MGEGGQGGEGFDALIVANGHHNVPFLPNFPGSFDGQVLHSQEYKVPEPFRDRRVVVVGAGNSGCDIAVELAGVAAKVFHSTRRGYWYVPKFVFGLPADEFGDRLRRLGVPSRLFQFLARKSAEMVLGPPQRFGLPKPDHAMFETHPIVNSQLYYAIGHGRVTPKPDVERLDGRTVRFADGTAEEVDVLLCATGFRLSFPFLDDAYLNLKEGRPVLYKNVFHPRIENLFFVGFIQPNSGGWFLGELQAELVARALKAPSPRLRAAIADRQDTRYFDYLPSLRHHLEVDYLRYERDLRKLLKLTGGREEAA
jgi:cation diffusion facilitator CzcD-associated flavoprotein CzcO